MRIWTAVAASLALAAASGAVSAVASAQHRQLGKHVHGRGTLDIALEGPRLTMELEAPGADIVGFEHEARTEAQKAALEKVERQLAAPQGLFRLPAAAGCSLEASHVALEGEDHDHDHGHEANDHEHADAKAGHGEHSDFRAEYSFNCKAPARLTTIGFDYFKVFAGAQRLDVTVIGPNGQSRFEVSRAKPSLDLGGTI